MKPFSAALALAALLVSFCAGFALAEIGCGRPECANSVEPLFSPGAEPAVISLIESAVRTIDVEMYQFSNMALAGALADASARGVRVRVILEPRLDGDDNLEMMEYLRGNGVDARWGALEFSRTHTKVMVVDGKTVLVGSQNWSYSAMHRNREAAVVVESSETAGEFSEVFESDWKLAG